MSISSYKRLTVILSVLCVGLVVLCGSLYWSHILLKVRVGWAFGQTEIFEQMRTQALRSGPAGASSCLDYVVSYYPSGTKQEPGSPLDLMVERERMRVARDIIGHLRSETGEDLGESPAVWIQRYGER